VVLLRERERAVRLLFVQHLFEAAGLLGVHVRVPVRAGGLAGVRQAGAGGRDGGPVAFGGEHQRRLGVVQAGDSGAVLQGVLGPVGEDRLEEEALHLGNSDGAAFERVAPAGLVQPGAQFVAAPPGGDEGAQGHVGAAQREQPGAAGVVVQGGGVHVERPAVPGVLERAFHLVERQPHLLRVFGEFGVGFLGVPEQQVRPEAVVRAGGGGGVGAHPDLAAEAVAARVGA